MIDGSVKDIKNVVAQKMLIYHTSGGTREAKREYRTRLSLCLQIFKHFLLPSFFWCRVTLNANSGRNGSAWLKEELKEIKSPPFNLLCFKYCFCCSPFCEEVIEWPSENCTALQCREGKKSWGCVCVCKIVRFTGCACAEMHSDMHCSCTWE